MNQKRLVDVNRYQFSAKSMAAIKTNSFATNNWPLVYILSDNKSGKAYVGETTDAITRLNTHLRHSQKSALTTVHLLSSDRFNKSATLDIESSLIKYMSADEQFELINNNLGLSDHNFYQRDSLYVDIFHQAWNQLRSLGVVQKSIEYIDNSDVFKYSPYKSLSIDQRHCLIDVLKSLLNPDLKNTVIQGGAGTGKSVLAIFLFKLIHSNLNKMELHELSSEKQEIFNLVSKVQKKYPKPKMALVVPMGSFRKTLKKAFRNVSGLKASMVIGPSDLAKQKYDIVLVDESHRLRKRVNLGSYYSTFDKACAAMGLDKNTCSELDWVIKQSDKAILFYDPNQSIKPSDTNEADFIKLKNATNSQVMTLTSQFRVAAGLHYVKFIGDLLNNNLADNNHFKSNNYELLVFDKLSDMIKEIQLKNASFGLSRLVAGYAWPWVSKKNPNLYDIEINNIKLRWNSTNIDWVNSKDAENEVGCIHTTQGYDLNYTGIIFGDEISYDESTDQIVIDKDKYFDRNGKQTIKDPAELKQYIINIYRTIMLRGIRGTYIYACDKGLQNYLKKHIQSFKSKVIEIHSKALDSYNSSNKIEPYINAVPLYDLRAAAGGFSDLQQVEHEDWVIVPNGQPVGKNIFACRVIGESMNRIIKDGAICLFRLDPGGSRNGKIVLVECADIQDGDGGSRYTVKEYQSFKTNSVDSVENRKILLKPRSYNPAIKAIELNNSDDENRYKVVGIFITAV